MNKYHLFLPFTNYYANTQSLKQFFTCGRVTVIAGGAVETFALSLVGLIGAIQTRLGFIRASFTIVSLITLVNSRCRGVLTAGAIVARGTQTSG